MMTSPLVSVIIPTFNVESYIGDCLQSIADSTYRKLEIIVVDNNSTDGTIERLRELSRKHEFLLTQEETQGGGAARNKGLSLATGEWIQFLDADDLLLPNKIAHQITLVDDADLIVGSCTKRHVDGSEETVKANPGEPWLDLFLTNLGNTCSNLWRTSVVRQVGGFDASLRSSQEYDLMFRLLTQKPRLIYDREPLTVIRERSAGSISKTDLQGKWERIVALRGRMLSHMRTHEPEVYQRCGARLQTAYIWMLHQLYPANPNMACNYYSQQIEVGFTIPQDANIKPTHRAMYNTLGFKATGEIHRALVFAQTRLAGIQRPGAAPLR